MRSTSTTYAASRRAASLSARAAGAAGAAGRGPQAAARAGPTSMSALAPAHATSGRPLHETFAIVLGGHVTPLAPLGGGARRERPPALARAALESCRHFGGGRT